MTEVHCAVEIAFMVVCYVSVTMSTQSPSPNIIIIITPIPRRYSCLSSSSSPSNYSDISPSQSPSYFKVTTTPSPLSKLRAHYHTPSSSLAYLMSTVFGNHRRISPRTLYSTFGPSTGVSGHGHARNDLLLLSHVYSMSQNLRVVYSSYTSLYSLVLNLDSAPPTCSQNLV